tara:strand:+ start:301 stop:1281 length:981 start_codon:yes stop_codon:yes gene_type:complete
MKIKKKITKKLGTGLSQLLIKDEELASIIKRPGRPKKIKAGQIKQNLKKIKLTPNDTNNHTTLPIHRIVPGKFQPRKTFNVQEIEDMAASIREHGLLNPILVRPLNNQQTSFEIIAGERRWRGAQIAKIHEVPVTIRDFDDETALGVALVENLQRTDLNLLEEAEGYQLLMNKFMYTQEKLSSHLGKSRSHIANILRLINLPKQIKNLVVLGELSYGHARAIVTLTDSDAIEIANEITSKGLSVRSTESLVKKIKKNEHLNEGKVRIGENEEKDTNILNLENELKNVLGLKVIIKNSKKNKGLLEIHYNNLDQLEPVLDKLRWKPK